MGKGEEDEEEAAAAAVAEAALVVCDRLGGYYHLIIGITRLEEVQDDHRASVGQDGLRDTSRWWGVGIWDICLLGCKCKAQTNRRIRLRASVGDGRHGRGSQVG